MGDLVTGLTELERRHWLVGGGEMGKVVRSMDWSRTPLGPIEHWPQSLRTTISLCLSSISPISLAWGLEHTQIYNDGYWPICGDKHPVAMGQSFPECWASAWPAIGDGFLAALKGETRYFENMWMFLDRRDYLEETCFTFSFSPIRDESGGIGGLFHPVTEVTAALVSERRIRTVRDVMSRSTGAHSVEEALVRSAEVLAGFKQDLPFVLFYMLDGVGTEVARLVASTTPMPESIAPAVIGWGVESGPGWPLRRVMAENRLGQNGLVVVEDLAGRFGTFDCGPYPEAPRKALMLPICLPGETRPAAVLVAGASSRLPFDEAYRAFYELLGGTIASSVASAFAYGEERKRAEALAEMDRAKTVFFSNVSHEFRTPLTLILGPLEDELAERMEPLPAGRRERLETVHRNSLRLLKLVNTLLDFSRIEAGRIEARYEATDLAAYTAELASNFRSAMEKGGLVLVVDCPPLPELVYVDREMWEKVVLNLLSNAFKHTFEGSVTVKLRWAAEAVELAVSDTGVGIAAVELPRLFERFRRVMNARSRTHEGTGIGLALVSELVKVHGGELRVESEEGCGSTFFATVKTGRAHLPAEAVVAWAVGKEMAGRAVVAGTVLGKNAVAHAQEAQRWVADEATAVAKPGDGEARPRILWADDNSDMRQYVQRLLAEHYAVVSVADGTAAVEAAAADPPDLVLTDVMMPGLDGFGLLAALRRDARTQMIPVILLSARAGEEASVEGIAAGADDYLMKPFSARELMARIGTHLRAAKLRREWREEVELRELALARSTEELKRSNLELKHSNEELQQFAYVASHDLQEPLRMVASYTGLLAKRYSGRLDADADEFIGYAVDGCNRMKRMITDLLAYSRVGEKSAGHEPTASKPIASEEALRAALSNLAALIEDTGATVTSDALPPVRMERMLLVQLFQNLIGNGIKYRREVAPRVHVAAEKGEVGTGCFPSRTTGWGSSRGTLKRFLFCFSGCRGGKRAVAQASGWRSARRLWSGRAGGSGWSRRLGGGLSSGLLCR